MPHVVACVCLYGTVRNCKLNVCVIAFYCELTYFGTYLVFAEADVSWWLSGRL